ncbi:insulinase family protein [Orbaceae bacterium ac157xtp]
MLFNRFLTSIIALFICGGLLSSCKSTQNDELNNNPALTHYVLDNGLNVYLLPHNKSGVEMRLIVHSGSMQETDTQKGLAHFVEHMAFKGTKNFPDKSSFKTLEQQGIKLGSHINAITTFNSTTYKLSLPNDPKLMETGLSILSDWAFNIDFKQQNYNSERNVIVEEWRLRQGFAYRINEKLEDLRYANSPYKYRNPIGDLNIVKQGAMSEAIAFYKKWYQPQRMSLVIVGNIDKNKTKELTTKLFGSTPKGDSPAPNLLTSQYSKQATPLLEAIKDKEQSQRIIQIMLQQDLTNPLNTSNGFKNDLYDQVWLTILNRRLTLLTENNILDSAQTTNSGTLLDPTRIQYMIIAKPNGDDFTGTVSNLLTELQRLARQPVTEQELEQTKQQILTKLAQQARYQTNYDNQYLAERLTNSLQYSMPLFDKQHEYQITRHLLNKMTSNDLKDSVEERLNAAELRIAVIAPTSDKITLSQVKLDKMWQQIRNSSPTPFPYKEKQVNITIAPPKAGTITKIEKRPEINSEDIKLSNGMRVILNQDSHLSDGIQFQLRIAGGQSLDANDKLGALNWAQQLAELSGYGNYSAREIAQFSKNNNITVSPFIELLFHGYQGSTQEEQLEAMFTLLYLKLTNAHFDVAKLHDIKKRGTISYQNTPVERKFLDYIHKTSFNHGERLVMAPMSTWQNFTAKQLQNVYNERYGSPESMTFVISGNFDSKKAKQLIVKWLSGIENRSPKSNWSNNGITPINKSMQHAYPYATSEKAMVSILYSTPTTWSQADQLKLQLLDSYVNVKLRTQLREKSSGVYTLIFSSQLVKEPSAYYLSRLNFTTSPNPDNVKSLIAQAQNVLTDIKSHGISSKDLNEAKQAWLYNYQDQVKSAQYWVKGIAQIATSGDDFTEFADQKEIIKNITIDDINQLANQMLGKNPKQFVLSPKK